MTCDHYITHIFFPHHYYYYHLFVCLFILSFFVFVTFCLKLSAFDWGLMRFYYIFNFRYMIIITLLLLHINLMVVISYMPMKDTLIIVFCLSVCSFNKFLYVTCVWDNNGREFIFI